MKFTVNVKAFAKEISAAVHVATRNLIKDHIDNNKLYMTNDNNSINVKAFNGVVALTSKLSNTPLNGLLYQFNSGGEVVINAKQLVSVLGSFSESDAVIFELKISNDGKSKEVILTLQRDLEQFQTLQCYEGGMGYPKKIEKFSKEITIDRDIFIKGIKKVSFATGFEKSNPTYLYWVLRAYKSGLARFVASTGGRFAILEYEGKSIVKTGSDVSILIHKDCTSDIFNTISSCTDDEIIIRQSDIKHEPLQVIISSSNHEIAIVGMDSSIKWGDENKLLNKEHTTKMIIQTSDLIMAADGVMASKDENDATIGIHRATVDIDIRKKIILFKSSQGMKSSRKVPIIHSESKEDSCTFDCPSVYLGEIASLAESGDLLQIESSGSAAPVSVRYYAGNLVKEPKDIQKVNMANNVIEKFTIIFATLK